MSAHATHRLGGLGATMAMAPSNSSASGTTLPNEEAGAGAVKVRPASELAEEEVLQYIVDNVNKVLTRKYSLVEFDAIQGVPLLQIVNDVFGTLSPAQQMDLEEVPLEEAVPRMIEFLTKTLGYRVPPLLVDSFPGGFLQAEPTVVYPTLYWVLSNMPQNEKRVYLARFLQRLDIPEAMRAQDEDVRALYQQYESLRSMFVETHRRVDALRTAHADPAEARRKVAALEEERDRLKGYIQAAEKKLSAVPDKEALVNASKALRAALEDEAKLAEKRVELQQSLISARQRCTEMQNRLQNLRRDAADGRVDVIVRRLRDEIQTNKMILEEHLPKEIEQKQRENEELSHLISEALDMQALTTENQQLDDALKKLQQKVKERQKPGEDGSTISTIKQQVQRVAKRKDEVLEQLTSLQADNSRTLNEIRDRENRIAQLREAHQMLKGDEFRAFSNQVLAKKAASEGMRVKLSELRVEWGVLTFTENALKAQFNALDAEIGDLEGKLGLQGYSRTVEALSKLSREKDTIEELKGKTLEELSHVVQDFTMAIRERRTKLAPLINELRNVRQRAAEVDQEWLEKKSQYEYQEGVLMEDISKMEREVQTLREETNTNESIYHRLQTQYVLLTAQLERLEGEREYLEILRSGANGPATEERATTAAGSRNFKCTYCGKVCATRGWLVQHLNKEHGVSAVAEKGFEQAIEDLQVRLRELQQRQRDIQGNYEGNVQQVEWFNNLKRVLEAKLQAIHSEGPRGRNALDSDIQQVMGSAGAGGNGVDMLVLTGN
ncbi:putative intraflagellar transport protein 81 isoform X1 [Trypanosoma grayi]|uniref:putative intraflagellar transport protein 81 isoform X1 n=1 Tax=Trypanosoma grayi TaxID=71804 RepID=UPI0004F454C6|nr:putative intraflagellar transport protein 81 isoform X1 [Trypanosoma grayi]KEG15674.1 putative intraflagellar transport protein 81 isoform X1 [Trypanosoma grayi]